MNLRNFFTELSRRNVIRMAGLYLVGAWLLTQVASTVLPTFDVPSWALRGLIITLALGFIPALIFSWVFELTPQGLKRDAEVAPEQSIAPQTARRMDRMIIAVLVLALGYFVFDKFVIAPSREAALVATTAQSHAAQVPNESKSTANAKSIAVLPFENLSEEKANAFFASGIQDEIITALAKISGLKVISRTSTAHYQSSPENLPQIAGELRVANILEGSVQKAGDKVHINVQLVRADTDAHLWAQSYDRGLADIFAVEAEVARSIAEALQTALSPEEKARLEAKPTENADAYVLYLRARDYQTRPDNLLQDLETAEHLYTRALQLDGGFALAHARLSATLALIYLRYQPTAEIKTRARSEAEESLRLRLDLGEGHLARALCFYWTEKDYDAALRELELAARLLPNNADVESTIAYIRRRQGRWSEALAGLESALVRDPQNVSVAEEVFRTECAVRDWAAATAAGRRALSIAPNSTPLVIEVSSVEPWLKGDLAPLRTALNAIPAGVDPDGAVTAARWDAALLARDYGAAERVIAASARGTVLTGFGPPLPKTYLLGCVALARGDAAHAQPFFEAARQSFESESHATPLDASRHAQLGLLYAYLGRKEDAMREGRRAVELLPESEDALEGPQMAGYLALIFARTGESEQALSLIDRLLTVPGYVSDHAEANITLEELRLRWQWDPLRNDPRFQKILAGPEPKTVYK